jgi:hypothetical protein
VQTTDAILSTRNRVLEHFFEGAASALRKWTARLAEHPCRNMECNIHRLDALHAFFTTTGLAPRAPVVTKSLAEIVSALQLIAAENYEAVANVVVPADGTLA